MKEVQMLCGCGRCPIATLIRKENGKTKKNLVCAQHAEFLKGRMKDGDEIKDLNEP